MTQATPGIASRLASQSALLMLGNLFTLLVGFPFQIFLAQALGAQQLGTFGLLEVIAQTAGLVFGFGLSAVPIRFVPHHLALGEDGAARQLLKSLYALTLVGAVVAALVLSAARPWLFDWVPELRAYPALYPFVGFMAVLGMLIGLSAQTLRALLDIRYMIIMASFLQLGVKVAVSVALISMGWQLAGYMVAVVASLVISMVGMLWGVHIHMRKLASGQGPASDASRAAWWSFSRTMYANSLLGVAGPPLERVILASSISLASVGILMAVRQLQGFTQVVFQILVTAIGPMFSGASARNDLDEVQRLYHIATDWICRLGFPLLAFLLVFGEEVLALYGPAFAQAGRWPLAIVLAGQAFNLLTGPHGAMLNMLGHEKTMFKLYLISTGALLLGLAFLGPRLGLVGVALATLAPLVFLNLIELHYMRQWLGIRWWSDRYRRLALPIAVTLVLAGVLKVAPASYGAVSLAAILVGLYLAFALAYLSGRLTREDVEVFDTIRRQLGWRS